MIDKTNKILEVRNLRQHFTVGVGRSRYSVKAVDDISFEVYKGEVFGLVGESGCGKTTTGRTIIKLYNPTDGTVDFLGTRVSSGYSGNVHNIRKAKKSKKKTILDAQPFKETLLKLKNVTSAKVAEKNQLISDLLKKSDSEKAVIMEPFTTQDHFSHELRATLRTQISDIDYELLIAGNNIKNNELIRLKRAYRIKDTVSQDKTEVRIQFTKKNKDLTKEEKKHEISRLKTLLENNAEKNYNKYQMEREEVLKRLDVDQIKIDFEILKKTREAEKQHLKEAYKSKLIHSKESLPDFQDAQARCKVNDKKTKEQIKMVRIEIKEIKNNHVQQEKELRKEIKENPEKFSENNEQIVKAKQEYQLILKEERKNIANSKVDNKMKESNVNKKNRLKLMHETKEEHLLRLSKISPEDIDKINEENLVYSQEIIALKTLKNHKENVMSKMQMIFQDPIASLNPRMIVREIIAEGLRVRGENRRDVIDEKVNKSLELVGLSPEHANRYPHEFSGGQRQRIGIARALIVEPEFIIADEPISALDVSIQAQVINLLNDIRKKLGITILFVAHDLSVVKYFSDRIAVMNAGKIVEMGESEEIFTNPIHPYTKSLLSAIPIPNPIVEEKRQRLLYDTIQHDYSIDKAMMHEILPGHFVYANDAELVKYKEKLNEKHL